MFKMPKGPQFPNETEILCAIAGLLIGLIMIRLLSPQEIVEFNKQQKHPLPIEQINE